MLIDRHLPLSKANNKTGSSDRSGASERRLANYSLSPAAWFPLNVIIYDYICITVPFMRANGTVYA